MSGWEEFVKQSSPTSDARRDADRWLEENPADSFRPVEPGDLDRLTERHQDDPADRDFGVPTGGGGIGGYGNSYPADSHYNRRFTPHEDASTPREEDDPNWDRTNWESILGQAGFQYKAHPNPTVNGFYWRPDEPENASSLGYRIEHPSPWEPYWKAHYGQGYRDGGSAIAMSPSLHNVIDAVAGHNSNRQWPRMSASKPAKKAPKPREPEQVWYDVHKHPEGVPGGMGRSPEHHLRGRGWSGHEINEGSGKKTIQYRNHKHPDFVISYGGGTSTKPDHNFRVLYMGTNTNIPRVTRSFSVAEAMNKVEELHQLHNGLVVQPMTHGAAATPPSQQKQPGVTPVAPKPARPRDMTQADSFPKFPDRPQGVSEAWNDRHEKQLQEIPDPPPIKVNNPVTVVKATKYQGLSGLISVFSAAERESWEEA